MLRIPVRSRNGNLALFVVGAVCSAGGIANLAMFIVDVWRGAKIMDLILQLGLLFATICSVWFVYNALQNLGMRPTHRRRTPHLVRPAQ